MTNYDDARKTYWKALDDFRDAAQAEMIRLLPDGVKTLEINETPRLTVVDVLDDTGASVLTDDYKINGDDSLYDSLDEIASDLDVSDWEAADAFLFRGWRESTFKVERPDSEATAAGTA